VRFGKKNNRTIKIFEESITIVSSEKISCLYGEGVPDDGAPFLIVREVHSDNGNGKAPLMLVLFSIVS
jgi:hypothetical protein